MTCKAQHETMRQRPPGREEPGRHAWRGVTPGMIAGNRPGPDGSILTADYVRSAGSGAEDRAVKPFREWPATQAAWFQSTV